MIFSQSKHKSETSHIYYENKAIESVTEYSFLGMLIKCNGNLSQSTLELTKKAKKVFFAIKSYTKSLNNLPIKVANNLFDSLVKPIMTYNSEVTYLDTYISFHRAKSRALTSGKEINQLDFIDKTPIENMHLKFCKSTLGIRKNASNLGARVELGRLPIECFIKTQTLLYLARLYNNNINPLLKEAFSLAQSLDLTGTYSWYTYAKNIVKETNVDLNILSTCKDIKDVNKIKNDIKLKMKNRYEDLIQNKFQNIDDKSKFFLYKKLKKDYKLEYYLNTSNFQIRRLITKFRISDHSLLIEKGRYFKIPREERLCHKCKILEDEKHFLLYCEYNKTLRNDFFHHICTENNNFNNLNEEEKIHYLLNPSSPLQTNKLGSFLKKSLELRAGDS